ncbi:MAG: NAD(P)H-hydrate epimerase [Planctomycetaceae bacterium]
MGDLILSREAVRDVDRRAIEDFGLPGIVLMENAGRGAAELLLRLGCEGPVLICAGKGNNGGDGFVIARHLENHGAQVVVWLFGKPEELQGDAAVNFSVLRAANTPIRITAETIDWVEFDRALKESAWIVDALLGTGMTGEVREPLRSVIDRINRISAPRKLAIDIPSGMDCNTGLPLGCAVRADHTATMVARKTGFDAPGAAGLTGQVHVIDIGIPKALADSLTPSVSAPRSPE